MKDSCPTDPDLSETTDVQMSKKMLCGLLQAKFCSTVANDIMLDTNFGVVRMWADETSRLSRFRMLFTIFSDRKFLLQIIVCLCNCTFLQFSV